MYHIANKYYRKYGNINISQTQNYHGTELGSWIHTQRSKYKDGTLSDEKREKLDLLGIRWNPQMDIWNEYYECACNYYETIGNLNVPDNYVVNGLNLGRWISVQRQAYNGREDCYIDEERISRLENIGMEWKVNSAAQTSFNEQVLYYYVKNLYPNAINRSTELGTELDVYIPDLNIALEYDGFFWHKKKKEKDENKDEMCLDAGIKLIRIREFGLQKTKYADNYILSDNKRNTFERTLRKIFLKYFEHELDVNIDRDLQLIIKYKSSINDPWYINYSEAKKFYETYGHLDVTKEYNTPSATDLYRWIKLQRQAKKGNTQTVITYEQIQLLDEIGMIWDKNEFRWEKGFEFARRYFEENNNLNVEQRLIYKGYALGRWINLQRLAYSLTNSRKQLSENQMIRLEGIGMIWDANECNWNVGFGYAKKFYESYGHLRVDVRYCVDDFKLGIWIQTQRKLKKGSNSKNNFEKIALLDSIDMIWDVNDYTWNCNLEICKKYYRKHGNLLVPQDLIIEGVNIGRWIANLRNAKKGKSAMGLTDERIAILESIGMVWDQNEYVWKQQYELAKEFFEQNGHLNIPRDYSVESCNIGMWLKNQKAANKRGTLSSARKQMLDEINIKW